MAFSTLGIEEMGLLPLTMSANIHPDKVSSILEAHRNGKEPLDGALRREFRQYLIRSVGYAEFCFCIDVAPPTKQKPEAHPFNKPHIHGSIGIKPGDEQKVRKALYRLTGGIPAIKHPVHLQPLEQVIAWSWYASRHELDAKLACQGAHFATTRSLARVAREIYESRKTSLETFRQLSRIRVQRKIEPEPESIQVESTEPAIDWDVVIQEIFSELPSMPEPDDLGF
jgi:hypothetical protein